MTEATVKPFTGRKALAIIVSAFAVIISVNLTLAFKAVATFPGLEVKNSYVASQEFDKNRAAQLALGWDVSAKVEGGYLILSIADKNGPVEPKIVTAIFGHATSVAADQTPEFRFDGQNFVAPVTLGSGNWNLRLVAQAADGTVFRQRVIVRVPRK